MNYAKRAYSEVLEFIGKLGRDSIGAYSAQAAFFVITSFFPFMILMMTFTRFIPVDINLQEEFKNGAGFNNMAGEFINGILKELSSKAASGAFLGVAGVSAVWAASRCLFSIIQGLNQIYETKEKRGYILLRLTALVYVLALQIILILSLIILVFGRKINDWLIITLNVEGLSDFFMSLRWVILLLALILFFMFVYTIVPERKTRFISETPGAVLSAVGWLGFTGLFSMYIDNFSNFGAVYGSLAAAVILMMWIYFCMYILFLGAEANVYIQSRRIGVLTVKEYLKRKREERREKKRG